MAFISFMLVLGGFDFQEFTFKAIRTAIKPANVAPAITMLGIIPATGALVLKYQDELRKHADEERKNRDEWRSEFAAALERIISGGSAMSRIAGVHTLVDTSDKHPDYQDETVQILCEYLRSDHSEDDPVIESAVLESLQNHYVKDALSSWSGHRLDLHGATIRNPFIFDDCRFDETVNLDGATFEQSFHLTNCSFERLTTMDTAFYQNPLIKESAINESWDVRLPKSLATDLIMIDTRINQILILGISHSLLFLNCIIGSIKSGSGAIGAIRADGGFIGWIETRGGGTIDSIEINNGSIGSIETDDRIGSIKVDNGSITLVKVGSHGTLELIDFQGTGKVSSIRVCGTIEALMMCGGLVDELKMTGGVIYAFYASANSEIEKLSLLSGRIVLLIKPSNFKLDTQSQSRVMKTISLAKAITA